MHSSIISHHFLPTVIFLCTSSCALVRSSNLSLLRINIPKHNYYVLNMRISSVAAVFAVGLAPVFAAALSFESNGKTLVSADDKLKVPGDSPLSLCPDRDHSKDSVTITRVDLLPNPPKP